MRRIVLDTETTGLSPSKGHRLTEIGCLEMLDREVTGRTFHTYLNPERELDEGAARITGLSLEFLSDKPLFTDVVDSFLEFIKGAELIIHNAPFDVGFINSELSRMTHPWGELENHVTILDTLTLAREKHPGAKNNLDALCQRYSIDNSGREFHGALLDAEILAEVYLAMTSGQVDLGLSLNSADAHNATASLEEETTFFDHKLDLLVIKADEVELMEHKKFVDKLDLGEEELSLWSKNS